VNDPMLSDVVWMSTIFFSLALTLVGAVLLLERHG